jgi:tetratricopeptide (TPR) repeat protein
MSERIKTYQIESALARPTDTRNVGAPHLASFARRPALSLPKGGRSACAARLSCFLRQRTLAGLLCLFVVALSLASLGSTAAAQTPEDLLATGRVDRALEILNEQIRSSPTAEAYNLLCRADIELSSWDTGIAACEKAVSLAPGNALYHLWLGRIYGEKAERTNFLKATGLAGKVRTEFERSVQLSPNNWEARTDLAEFYLEAPAMFGGGKDKARAQADLLAPLDPAMAHWVLARLAQKNKDDVAAEREYWAAIDASQGGARAWVSLAGFYLHLNRLAEMDRALQTMETRPLDHPAALVDGASILMRTSQDDSLAIHLLRRYISSSSQVEEAPAFKAHYLLGELLEKQGDPAAAEEYRTALAMAHSYRPAQDRLKRLAHSRNSQDELESELH